MYTVVSSLGFWEFLQREGVTFAAALLIAELFYKFHSFTLEAAAFLLTWYLLSGAANLIVARGRSDR